MKQVVFYRRNGKQISESRVLAAKLADARARRTGRYTTNLRCNINLAMAERLEAMTLIEYCNWSGAFTYRTK